MSLLDLSLDASPGPSAQAMVAPVFLACILSAAREHEVPLTALFRGLEVEAADLDVPNMVISQRDAITVVRRALALGQLSAATLGDAIDLSVRHASSAGCLLQVREVLSSEGHQLLLEAHPGDQDLQRFLVDLTFASVVQLRRQITSARYSPVLVELESQAVRLQSMPAVGFSVERAIRRCLPEVAAATGFSDARAFTRAFKRWTGRPPSQIRDPHAADETLASGHDG